MRFISKWITTNEFRDLQPINVFHKELDRVQVSESPIKNYHVHFRKKLSYEGKGKVELFISADDYYKLYINDTFVAQGPAPAYAHYYNYNQLDITSFLKEGDNIIAVHVYYQGEINRVWNSGDNRQGMIADFYIDEQYMCGTDESWTYHKAEEFSGECIGYNTQYLENIDFRRKKPDWKNIEFSEKDCFPAVVVEEDDHCFVNEPADCLDVYLQKPEQVVYLGKNQWFVDFGTEVVGQFYMKAQGQEGQTVKIQCGEELIEGETYSVRYQMRCNCTYEEECILSGKEDEFEFFDYKAFRYVKVISNGEGINPDSFAAIVRHHRFNERLKIISEVDKINNIWKLCVNTLKWGTQEGFLDCPSREKGQYLGDFTVSGRAYLYITNDVNMYRKTLYDFARSSEICKGLISVVPGSYMQEIADFSLQYPMQVLFYYEYTKDIDTLRELYPFVKGSLEYFDNYQREDGLIEHVNDKWNLIDWPKTMRDGYDLPGNEMDADRNCHCVLNAHYLGAVITLQKIQSILGINYCDREQELKKAFLNIFYNEENKLFRDSEGSCHYALHSSVLSVFYGIAPEESWGSIKHFIMKKGLSCGTQFAFFVLKALGKMGSFREEFELLINESRFSWMNMLKEGATTCFEVWGKEYKDNISLCHPWSCAPIVILVEDFMKGSSESGKLCRVCQQM